jgi:GTP-binding protein YchF
LAKLAELEKSEKIVPTTIEFVDIAGLVKGASKGEGLGNQFLANIRETDAIAHVVRCFVDENVIHVEGTIDPQPDVETIKLELVLADLQSVEKRLGAVEKKAKGADIDAKVLAGILAKVKAVLDAGKLAKLADLNEDEQAILKKELPLLTSKPVIYVANIAESDIGNPTANPMVQKVQALAKADDAQVVLLSSKIEAELAELDEASANEMLKELGITESGIQKLAQSCFTLLGLQTYLTTGEKETRAWTIHKGWKAPQAAGVIHTDFEKKFIKAEIFSYDDVVSLGSIAKVKEMGKLRLEGKDYVMREGDVVDFKIGG